MTISIASFLGEVSAGTLQHDGQLSIGLLVFAPIVAHDPPAVKTQPLLLTTDTSWLSGIAVLPLHDQGSFPQMLVGLEMCDTVPC